MKIHLLQSPHEAALSYLQENLDPGIEMTLGEQIPNPADYSILVGGVPPREFVEASPHLEGIIIPWAGLPTATC